MLAHVSRIVQVHVLLLLKPTVCINLLIKYSKGNVTTVCHITKSDIYGIFVNLRNECALSVGYANLRIDVRNVCIFM